MNYRIIRSAKRRRAAFRVGKDSCLEILVPQKLSDSAVAQMVSANRDVIARLLARVPKRILLDFSEGSTFMLLGTPYPLRFTQRLRIFDNAFLIPRGTTAEIKSSIISLYKELALAIIRKRLPVFQEKTGAFAEKIRISSANTRWGSRSSTGTISFSWKLIQCPLECVDYVIVHELSHQKEMNHSAKFWSHVALALPDYQQKRQKLNAFAARLPIWD